MVLLEPDMIMGDVSNYFWREVDPDYIHPNDYGPKGMFFTTWGDSKGWVFDLV